jgi:ribonuclease-3
LGDAVLEYVVSGHLYRTLPGKEEGFLTALRANIVNTQNLARLAKKLEIGKSLKLSRGESLGGGGENPSLLANTVEAIIGAIYLDQGISSAKNFIHENLLVDLNEKLKEPLKDAKSRLQESVQAEGKPAPHYKVASETGPDHNKKFVVAVSVEGQRLGEGTGKSKQEAEQAAAENALEELEALE